MHTGRPLSILGLLPVLGLAACVTSTKGDPAVLAEAECLVLFGVYSKTVPVKDVTLYNIDTGEDHKLMRDRKTRLILSPLPAGRYHTRRLRFSRAGTPHIDLESLGPPIQIKPGFVHYLGDLVVRSHEMGDGSALSLDLDYSMAKTTITKARESYPAVFESHQLVVLGRQEGPPPGQAPSAPE